MLKNWNWQHTLLTLCGLGAVLCSAVAEGERSGTLALHISAGVLTIGAMAFGYLSKALTDAGAK